MLKRFTLIFVALSLLLGSCTSIDRSRRPKPVPSSSNTPKNIIFMIVDGMGFEYVKAARIYNGLAPLDYENFPCKTRVTTCAHEGSEAGGRCLPNHEHVTDSAASATAIACGLKVSNSVISRSIPGSKLNAKTILEIAKDMDKSTGIIATKLFTDATPAAFVGHADTRGETEEILKSMFEGSMPNVILGADTPLHRKYAKESRSSYQFVDSTSELKKLLKKMSLDKTCSGSDCPHIYGGFGQHQMLPGAHDKEAGLLLEINPDEQFVKLGVPHLSEMTEAALKILSKNNKGFFLMVESSNPDMIGHHNQHFDENEQTPSAIAVLVREMLEVENTIKVLRAFVAENPDTLVVLTADHETGGLVIEDHKTDCLGKTNCLPSVRWTSAKYEPHKKDSLARHTGVDVPLYAIGMGSERFCQESINNIDIKNLALGGHSNATVSAK